MGESFSVATFPHAISDATTTSVHQLRIHHGRPCARAWSSCTARQVRCKTLTDKMPVPLNKLLYSVIRRPADVLWWPWIPKSECVPKIPNGKVSDTCPSRRISVQTRTLDICGIDQPSCTGRHTGGIFKYDNSIGILSWILRHIHLLG